MKAQIKIINNDGSEFLYGEWEVQSISVTRDMPPSLVGLDGSWTVLDEVETPAPPILNLCVYPATFTPDAGK